MDDLTRAYHNTLTRIHGGRLVEVRAIGVPHKGRSVIVSGYYRDYDKAAADIAELERAKPEGVYMTLQDLHPGCFARSPDRLTWSPRHTTKDTDVLGYRWLLIDIDPVRPSGISSSNKELASALATSNAVERLLPSFLPNHPEYVVAMSGNGVHVLVRLLEREYRIPGEALRVILQRLDVAFSSAEIAIDQTVWSPAQLTKLYGTVARKGFEVDDRTHRRSLIAH